MYAITDDWMLFKTEIKTVAPTNHSIKIEEKYSRQEEFRSALECYMADYRKHHGIIANKARCTHDTSTISGL
jgi:hypothetical protein